MTTHRDLSDGNGHSDTHANDRLGANSAGRFRPGDWAREIAADPELDHPEPPDGNRELEPYVETKGQTPVGGYAQTAEALVVNVSDQGAQLTLIPLYSGGTGLNRALLVYVTQAGSVKLLTWITGDRLHASVDGSYLVVSEPAFVGWEPHCCASGITETRYRLDSGHLVMVRQTVQPNAFAKLATVNEYYYRISHRRYREAYALLSPHYKTQLPFERWVSQQSDNAALPVTTRQQDDGTVAVDLATETHSANKATSRHLRGRWALVWSAEAKQWLLDAVHFR